MNEEVLTLVKIPLSEIEQSVRSKHSLPATLVDIRLEDDSLVLYFAEKPKDHSSELLVQTPTLLKKKRRRKSRRKRNRTKTRGWSVITRMTNSKGQKCAIYEPFVKALQDPELTDEQQRQLAVKILKANRNKPSDASVRYFLENTLEYLRRETGESS